MRTLPGEGEFAKYLLNLGNCTLNDVDDNLSNHENCIAEKDEDIVKTIFKDLMMI